MTPTTLVQSVPSSVRAVGGDEALYEVINGCKVELSRGIYQIEIANVLARHLSIPVETGKLGRVRLEALFALPGIEKQRRPDLAFVSYTRWARQRPFPRGDAWPVSPELAVEVVSPSNFAADLILKVHDYFQTGTQQVWVVWPSVKQVYVYESPTQVRILTITDELDGGAVVPGFRLPVAAMFEATVEDETDNGAS